MLGMPSGLLPQFDPIRVHTESSVSHPYMGYGWAQGCKQDDGGAIGCPCQD